METMLIVIAIVSAVYFFSLYSVYRFIVEKVTNAILEQDKKRNDDLEELRESLMKEISFQSKDLEEMEESLSHVFEVFDEYEQYVSVVYEDLQMSKDSRFFELIARTKMVRDMLKSLLEKEIPDETDSPRTVAKIGKIKAG